MDCCLVCLEFYDKIDKRVYTASEEWHSCNMPAILEKHLSCWFDHNEIADSNEEQWMCRQCWQLLIAFNKLYEKIEKHNYQELLLSHVNIEIKEENALNEVLIPIHDVALVETDVKLLNKSKTSSAITSPRLTEADSIDFDKETLCEEWLENAYDESIEDNETVSNEATCFEKLKDIFTTEDVTEKNKKKTKKEKREKRVNDLEKYDQILKELKYTLVCSLCCENLSEFVQLKLHFREQHIIRGYAECCARKHYTSLELVDHLNLHADPQYFKCSECGKAMSSRFSLETHMKLHANTLPFPCKECGKRFKTNARLSQHQLTHMPEEEKQHACEECGRRYASKHLLRKHVNAVHINAYVRICDLCGEKFRCRFAFEAHMEEHNMGEAAKFACELCGSQLKSKYLLNRHMNYKHNEKYLQPEKCPHCDFIGSTNLTLKTHIRRHHTKTPEHKCNLCGKIFERPKKLKEHISTKVLHKTIPFYDFTKPFDVLFTTTVKKLFHYTTRESKRKKRKSTIFSPKKRIQECFVFVKNVS